MGDASRTFNVVVAGCGGMARQWVRIARQTPGLNLIGLTDIRREAAEKMAADNELPASAVYGTLAGAIEGGKADVVFDVTIPDAHEQVATEALSRGCHVLGEKPLAASLEAARRVVAMAQKSGRVYAVMQNRRWNPQIVGLRDFLRSGAIGDVEELHADMFIGAHFGGFREQMDFPLLLDMAIHTFDEARFLGGCDPVSVYCHSWNPRRSWYGKDASAVCIFEMTGGIVFSYRGSWCAEGLHADWNGDWRIVGGQGTAKWDGQQKLQAQAHKPGGKREFFWEMQDLPIEPKSLTTTGHEGLIRDFVQCLQDGRAPETVCTDNIKSLAMVEAAVQSARTGQKVKVEW